MLQGREFDFKSPVVAPLNSDEILIMGNNQALVFHVDHETSDKAVIEGFYEKIHRYGTVYVKKIGKVIAAIYEYETNKAKLVTVSFEDAGSPAYRVNEMIGSLTGN